jgi:hypothetical protein
MFQYDLLISAVVGGLFYAALDALAGKRLRLSSRRMTQVVDQTAIDLASLRSSLAVVAGDQLATELASLDELGKRLESGFSADLTTFKSTLQTIVAKTTKLVRSSQEQIMVVSSQIGRDLAPIQSELDRDPAGLARQSWFPAGNGHDPAWPHELRSAPRFPFPHAQPITLDSDNGVPDASQFFDVQFRDISTSGFSFYLPHRIATNRIIARLGVGPNTVLVLARIVHQTEVPSGDGATFRIGCQIIRRVL